MKLPRVSLVRRYDTHRLIPAKYTEGGESVLARTVESDEDLEKIFDLDNATNDRLIAENDLLPGIGIRELVFNVPNFRIVNAAFCHAHPLGSRFNSPDRGGWYAAFELETAEAEAAYDKWLELLEVNWIEEEEISYDDYLADFSAEFHDIRNDGEFRKCLNPESYVASQELAQKLIEADSLGVIYPSVRKRKGTCIVCFRPALVTNVRRDSSYVFRWSGQPKPHITVRA